jgi:DNA-binding transcriptional MerR regulator
MSRRNPLRIGEVAGRAGVPAKTIRFWEDQQLLPPGRTPAGYPDYGPAILERLVFIRHSQAAGLTLEHIREVLDIRDSGQPPCVHVTSLIARRLAEVEAGWLSSPGHGTSWWCWLPVPRSRTRPTATGTARSRS